MAAEEHIAAVALLVRDHDAWSSEPRVFESVVELQRRLSALSAAEPPFALVDSALSFRQRADRMMAWLRSHPAFRCAPMSVVDDLPAESGSRGLRLAADLGLDDVAMDVPTELAISTEGAEQSREIGPLLEEPGLGNLRDYKPNLLTLHLLVEHAKCLEADAAAAAAAAAAAPLAAGGPAVGGAPAVGEWGPHVPAANVSFARTTEEVFGDRRAGKAMYMAYAEAEGAMRRGGPVNLPPQRRTALAVDGITVPPASPASPASASAASSPDKRKNHPWGSRWRAYISLLPEAVPNSLYWDEGDWAALRGTAVFVRAAMHFRTSVQFFFQLRNHFVGIPAALSSKGSAEGAKDDAPCRIVGFDRHFTWAGYRWAQAMVMSRQNRLPNLTGGSCLGLVPLFDMANHAPEANGKFTASARMRDPSSAEAGEGGGGPAGAAAAGSAAPSSPPPRSTPSLCLCLTAFRPFKAGEELTHSYGSRPGSQVLQYQGFATPESLAPGFDFGAPVVAALAAEDDPLLKVRASALLAAGVEPDTHSDLHFSAAAARLRSHAAGMADAATRQALDGISNAELVQRLVPDAERLRWPASFEVPAQRDMAPGGRPVGLFASSTAGASAASTDEQAAQIDDGGPPEELLQYCRIAAMTKADAVPVLRLMQQHTEKRKAVAAAAQKHGGGGGGGGHGHSHGGQDCHGHGGADGSAPALADIGPLRFPALGTPASEAAARAMAAAAVAQAVALIDEGAGAARGVLPAETVQAYRAAQRAMLEGALKSLSA